MIHAIYGNGKGKTSSAVGMAIRAAGHGYEVGFVQFMKDGRSSETQILKNIPNIDYFCPGSHEWALPGMGLAESQQKHALCCLKYVLENEKDMLVCDEILNVPLFGLNGDKPFTYNDIGDMLQEKPPYMELVMTGLYLPSELEDICDYSSCIQPKKHPFDKGVMARPGVEY